MILTEIVTETTAKPMILTETLAETAAKPMILIKASAETKATQMLLTETELPGCRAGCRAAGLPGCRAAGRLQTQAPGCTPEHHLTS